MCDDFMKVSQCLNDEEKERYWRKFEILNTESDATAVVILQEPKFMDRKIEPALIKAVNFISDDYKNIYVCNLLPVPEDKINKKNIDRLQGAMDRNVKEICKIIDGNKDIDVIYGARDAYKFLKIDTDRNLRRKLLNCIEEAKSICLKQFVDKYDFPAYPAYGPSIDKVKKLSIEDFKKILG